MVIEYIQIVLENLLLKIVKKIGDGYIVLSEILIQLFYNKFKIDEIDTIFVNRIRGTSM